MAEFNLWVGGCSHVHTDIQHGRESLAEAIRHSEKGGDMGGPPFNWDVMLHLGDLTGEQGTPQDRHGREVLRQLAASEEHPRECFYNLLGNHDGSGPAEETQWWFRKWIDPTGENPQVSGVRSDRRPYPVEGTWERYKISIGNMVILMMGDRNDGGPPAGRADRGGYPAGKVTRETFDWWRREVQASQDRIIITCHHHMLRDTTVASGRWEGVDGDYHGRFEDGAPQGASYLYFVGDEADSDAFSRYLADNPGSIDMWLGGHTHAGPDDTHGGRSHIERKWGVTFANCAAMTKHHVMSKSVPLTRLFTFEDNADSVSVRCYLHTGDYAAQGWYDKARRDIPLRHRFSSNPISH